MDTATRTSVLNDLDAIEKICMRWAVTESNSIEPLDMAHMLADFYTGVEAVCLRVVESTEGPIDQTDEDWAPDLLESLPVSVEGKRPELITPSLKRHLSQFLNLREFLREAPEVPPSPEVLKALLCSMEATLTQFRSSVFRFLERLS